MIDEALLKNEEKAIFSLRALYKKYGYLPFKMSKFEEYDFYVRNKDFLVSDNIITFNDLNGKLMALKPDVTLSIIKNGKDISGQKQKVYYSENVYRASGSTHQYKEIMQTGVECIGDIDAYDIFEIIFLAAQSLDLISDNFVLDVSHLGILSSLLDEVSSDKRFRKKAIEYIAKKSTHEIRNLCMNYNVSDTDAEKLCVFSEIYGDIDTVLTKLEKVCTTEEALSSFEELKELCKLIKLTGFADKIRLDFSVVNDMNYYNGIVFKGFLDGICEGVLAGGQYDNLMTKIGRKSKAVGFAIYLDLLEDLGKKDSDYDIDILLLYSDLTEKAEIIQTVKKVVSSGRSIGVHKKIPKNIRYKEVLDLTKEDVGIW